MHGKLAPLVIAFLASASSAAQEEETARAAVLPLALTTFIELPNVEGRIDHMTVDLARERLFVAALGNDSVEVLDLAAGAHRRSLRGPGEPQGILYLAEQKCMVVACGKSGTCEVYDGETLEKTGSIEIGDDPDNLRYDAQRKLVYVAYGEGEAGLALVDPANWTVVERIPLAGHPESFQIEPSGKRAFVNVPDVRGVVVLDLEKREKLVTWRIDEAQSNFPMALAQGPHASFGEQRVLVGCRAPAKLVVRSCAKGEVTQVLDLSGDTDDIFVDAERRRVYVACGEGFVDVFAQEEASFRPLTRVETAAGARTCLFVPERKQLYVAVPHRVNQRAEVLVFDVVD